MSRELSIGYSPCPNDTFIFYALMHGLIPLRHVCFSQPVLDDVETLNRWALAGRLDVTKISFHALGHVLDRYTMLNSGAALGRGCGPLLVTRTGKEKEDPLEWKIAVPGSYTTAALLLKLFLPAHYQTEVMRFDTIMDAVADGRVDGGVIIHESRFTYQDYGLTCVQDLGQWWETDTGLPLPLGCIAARRSLDPLEINEIEQAVSNSVQWAHAQPDRCSSYIKQYANELDDEVIAAHIGLYVNDFSVRLGNEGRAAVEELLRRGREVGAFPGTSGVGS
jgi:1,4-dihydroxy-6-naphthoate synthase